MKKLISCLLLCYSYSLFATEVQNKSADTTQTHTATTEMLLKNQNACTHWMSFLKPVCQRLHQIWTEGNTDLYLSGYAWHNRYTYRPEKIKTYNEAAWGGGLGKGLFDENGNWQGLYAIAFMDSHNHVEPAAGYAFLKVFGHQQDLKAGIGYTILVTSRGDILNGIPFPGVLPWVSIFYKKTTLAATYIPGAVGAGNVLYILGKYTF
ncbi:MAG: lipid IV(A) palmitoyltransferase PagP [Legionellales bacterium]